MAGKKSGELKWVDNHNTMNWHKHFTIMAEWVHLQDCVEQTSHTSSFFKNLHKESGKSSPSYCTVSSTAYTIIILMISGHQIS